MFGIFKKKQVPKPLFEKVIKVGRGDMITTTREGKVYTLEITGQQYNTLRQQFQNLTTDHDGFYYQNGNKLAYVDKDTKIPRELIVEQKLVNVDEDYSITILVEERFL